MPRKSNQKRAEKDIKQYKHEDKTRVNNPPVGLVNMGNDPSDTPKKKYKYDPHLDPQLEWAGKAEHQEVDVDTVSLHVHERIDPLSIIGQVHNQNIGSYQYSLFEPVFEHRALREELNFYQHKNKWANRLIAGDSLLIMNSLLEKEGMEGQVQMIYIDPPYGISYGSNFQPFVNKRDVKDGKDDDLTAEPEMIKAFRDTWELGIHSYLTYLRDRLLLSRDLLTDSGSCFVQISDENVHLVRNLMDEIFGKNNFVSIISFRTKSPLRNKLIAGVSDYIIWYAKDVSQIKFHKLYTEKPVGEDSRYNFVELPNGERRRLTSEEKKDLSVLPKGSKLFVAENLLSAGSTESCIFEYEFEGKKFFPSGGRSWKTNLKGMKKLEECKRLIAPKDTLGWVSYVDDFPAVEITNNWFDTQGEASKIYAVQTAIKPIQRCMLMCTDPGDLVFDPTCGSGTTASVAEQWGRRWITCDTSRVSLTLTRQRLMTGCFDWYKLAHPEEGVSGGFVYKTVPHITLGAITNEEPSDEAVLYDQPHADKSIVRISGPFTVEAVPSPGMPQVIPIAESKKAQHIDTAIVREGETVRQSDWRDELLNTGIQAKGGKKIEFVRVEVLQGTKYLHADAETTDGQRVVVSFGPNHAPLEQRQVELALEEAQSLKPNPKIVLFAAFQFDPEASKDIDEIQWPGVTLLKAQMNADLLTSDLRKKQSSSQSFWLLGQPDVSVSKDKDGKYVVSVNGFDYYDPKTGEVQSGGNNKIVLWMLDTDYDGRSIFPTQVFFPMAGKTDGWNKIAKNLKAELNEELLEVFEGSDSLPFDAGENKRVAVKIVDDRGIESFCIRPLE